MSSFPLRTKRVKQSSTWMVDKLTGKKLPSRKFLSKIETGKDFNPNLNEEISEETRIGGDHLQEGLAVVEDLLLRLPAIGDLHHEVDLEPGRVHGRRGETAAAVHHQVLRGRSTQLSVLFYDFDSLQ